MSDVILLLEADADEDGDTSAIELYAEAWDDRTRTCKRYFTISRFFDGRQVTYGNDGNWRECGGVTFSKRYKTIVRIQN